jgi:hypothetical protein
MSCLTTQTAQMRYEAIAEKHLTAMLNELGAAGICPECALNSLLGNMLLTQFAECDQPLTTDLARQFARAMGERALLCALAVLRGDVQHLEVRVGMADPTKKCAP